MPSYTLIGFFNSTLPYPIEIDTPLSPSKAMPDWQKTAQGLPFHFSTVPQDPRFPGVNQAANCWQNYVDFHKCTRLFANNPNDKRCQAFKRAYMTMCPGAWIERWDDNLEQGILPFDLDPPPELVQRERGE